MRLPVIPVISPRVRLPARYSFECCFGSQEADPDHPVICQLLQT